MFNKTVFSVYLDDSSRCVRHDFLKADVEKRYTRTGQFDSSIDPEKMRSAHAGFALEWCQHSFIQDMEKRVVTLKEFGNAGGTFRDPQKKTSLQ